MKFQVVIGANFGDEGKGLMTDYFASKATNGIVVRFNGGAQAGHTVVDPSGHRHVFHHFGSGTFAGLPTYLSKHFMINPIAFVQEMDKLKTKIKSLPRVIAHPECIVTTPYDMLINQIVESTRGARHGSCGMGINETFVRSQNSNFRIEFCNLMYDQLAVLKGRLEEIRKVYLSNRLNELGVKAIPLEFVDILSNDGIIDAYLEDIKVMRRFIESSTTHGALKNFDEVIFEGAQGLLLDQYNDEYFPHLTRSSTGMENVAEIISLFNYNISTPVEIVYATRCYMTRHGEGRFDSETFVKPYKRIIDLTNVSNPWQGTIRYGLLDIDLLAKTIQNDVNKYVVHKFPFSINLAITCLDQLDSPHHIRYMSGGVEKHVSIKTFYDQINRMIPNKTKYLSYGMTRDTVEKVLTGEAK